MANHYVEDFPMSGVRALTKVLSLPPDEGEPSPSQRWLERQKRKVDNLPAACCRPDANSHNPVAMIKRGLMKASEKHSLPLVPHAAILCPAHWGLHPWRTRGLFMLLAAEVGSRCDRFRKFGGFDGFPPSRAVQAFVGRMNEIAGLWMAPEDFEAVFGRGSSSRNRDCNTVDPNADDPALAHIPDGCEACILAAVGARGQLLADLRANMIARRRRRGGGGGSRDPSLMRWVESWIDCFGDEAGLVRAQSEELGTELKGIRRELGKRKRERRRRRAKERDQRSKNANSKMGGSSRTGSTRKPERNERPYPLPKGPNQGYSSPLHRDDRGKDYGHQHAHGHVYGHDQDHNHGMHNDAQNRIERHAGSDLPPEPVSPVSPTDQYAKSPLRNVSRPGSPHEPYHNDAYVSDEDDDDDDGEDDPDWAAEVGSYYFSPTNPGARAEWGRSGAQESRRSSVQNVHPAFRSSLVSNGPWDFGFGPDGNPVESDKADASTGAANADPASGSGSNSARLSRPPPDLPWGGSEDYMDNSAYARAHAEDGDDGESQWTEPTLHTAGGRTNLDLAPHVPQFPNITATESLAGGGPAQHTRHGVHRAHTTSSRADMARAAAYANLVGDNPFESPQQQQQQQHDEVRAPSSFYSSYAHEQAQPHAQPPFASRQHQEQPPALLRNRPMLRGSETGATTFPVPGRSAGQFSSASGAEASHIPPPPSGRVLRPSSTQRQRDQNSAIIDDDDGQRTNLDMFVRHHDDSRTLGPDDSLSVVGRQRQQQQRGSSGRRGMEGINRRDR